MRIVIDARFYGLENAGPGRYTKGLLDYITSIDEKNEYMVLLRKKYFNEIKFRKNVKKILADYPHYSFKEQIQLPITLYKLKPDLVHFPFFNVPILYFGKFVTTIHDLTMHKFSGKDTTTRSYPSYYLWRLAYKIAFYKAVSGANKIIVPSKYVKNDLQKYYDISSNKIEVIYEGIEKKFKATKTARVKLDNYFLYVGSAYPHKNLKTAIEAIKILNQNSKVKYLLAISSARSVFLERMKTLVKELDAEEYVKFLGFLSDEELADCYKNSIAFVYPTLSEGFGLPGLEAMTAGTLSLVSDLEVLREVYGESAIYFNPKSPIDLAEKMNKIINQKKDTRNEKIKSSQKHIQKYSWDTMARATMEVYNGLL